MNKYQATGNVNDYVAHNHLNMRAIIIYAAHLNILIHDVINLLYYLLFFVNK